MSSTWTFGSLTLSSLDRRGGQEPRFAQPWHAQALALVDALIKAGLLAPQDWTDALGAALRQASTEGRPDDEETYYLAVLGALEEVADRAGLIGEAERLERQQQWRTAYERTPHGEPVELLSRRPGGGKTAPFGGN